MDRTTGKKRNRFSANKNVLYLIAIIVAGFNLRPAITSVGPLLGTIRDDMHLENWSAGLITSLPLIAFAVVSPLAPKIGRRIGNERAVLFGMVLLFIAVGMRSIPQPSLLFIGTAIVGAGIAMMNVLLPAVIKEKFPHKVGQMTSVYTTSMAIMASLASGLSVPLAMGAGLGWELALVSWGIVAIIGIAVWIVIIKREPVSSENRYEESSQSASLAKLLKSPLAWQVSFFMGLQSFLFYVMVSWLPEMMYSFGFSINAAGWLASYAQFVGLPTMFLTPVLAEKYANQQGIVLAIGGGATIGFIGLLFGGPLPLIFIWVTIIGFASAGSISLSLAMLGMRARNAQQASTLSGMAQSIGYVFAAVGPLFIGLLFDLNDSWTVPLIAIIIVSVLMTLSGLGAGRDKYVTEE
ncbi:MAG TPA: MFS transporter [Virgibacillus sp.]|nr:MFS transporter [Virgibacillus sp.]